MVDNVQQLFTPDEKLALAIRLGEEHLGLYMRLHERVSRIVKHTDGQVRAALEAALKDERVIMK
jgi:hypothetical protein